jgi:hypothetical protein
MAGVLGGLILSPSLAFADEEPAPPSVQIETVRPAAPPPTVVVVKAETAPPPPEVEDHWYGWQVLIVDGASIVTMPIIIGFGGYFLGGPIVHMAHGEYWRAIGSLGLRIGAPIAGAFLGAGLLCQNRGGEWGCLGEALLGLIAGALAAAAIDASAIAWEKVPVEKQKPKAFAPTAFTPLLLPREGGAELGVGFRF